MEFRPRLVLCQVSLLLLTVGNAGCGDGGPEFGEVSGTIMLDGKPLKDIAVRFEDEGGSASIAKTDAAGKYVLQFSLDKMGAPVGKHKVTIFTPAPVTENFGTGDRSAPEIVPEKYNVKSTLTREVESGSQVIDFDLTSGP